MRHFTLGLGIVISAYVLKPLYHSLLLGGGAVINPAFLLKQHLGELSLLVGIFAAWYVGQRLALQARFPHPIPGYRVLKVGVWCSLFLSFMYWCSFVPFLVFIWLFLSGLRVTYLLQFLWPSIAANALVLYGIARALLAANPNFVGGNVKPNPTIERDAPQAGRPSL